MDGDDRLPAPARRDDEVREMVQVAAARQEGDIRGAEGVCEGVVDPPRDAPDRALLEAGVADAEGGAAALEVEVEEPVPLLPREAGERADERGDVPAHPGGLDDDGLEVDPDSHFLRAPRGYDSTPVRAPDGFSPGGICF